MMLKLRVRSKTIKTKTCSDTNRTVESNDTLTEMAHILVILLKGEKTIKDVCEETILETVQEKIEEQKQLYTICALFVLPYCGLYIWLW